MRGYGRDGFRLIIKRRRSGETGKVGVNLMYIGKEPVPVSFQLLIVRHLALLEKAKIKTHNI